MVKRLEFSSNRGHHRCAGTRAGKKTSSVSMLRGGIREYMSVVKRVRRAMWGDVLNETSGWCVEICGESYKAGRKSNVFRTRVNPNGSYLTSLIEIEGSTSMLYWGGCNVCNGSNGSNAWVTDQAGLKLTINVESSDEILLALYVELGLWTSPSVLPLLNLTHLGTRKIVDQNGTRTTCEVLSLSLKNRPETRSFGKLFVNKDTGIPACCSIQGPSGLTTHWYRVWERTQGVFIPIMTTAVTERTGSEEVSSTILREFRLLSQETVNELGANPSTGLDIPGLKKLSLLPPSQTPSATEPEPKKPTNTSKPHLGVGIWNPDFAFSGEIGVDFGDPAEASRVQIPAEDTNSRYGYSLPAEFTTLGGIVLPVHIDGEYVGPFLLDTGCNGIVLSRKTAQRLKISKYSEVQQATFGKMTTTQLSIVKSLTCGPFSSINPFVGISDIHSLTTPQHSRILRAGILGYPLFSALDVEIFLPENIDLSTRPIVRIFKRTRGLSLPDVWKGRDVKWVKFAFCNMCPQIELREGDPSSALLLDLGANCEILTTKRRNSQRLKLPLYSDGTDSKTLFFGVEGNHMQATKLTSGETIKMGGNNFENVSVLMCSEEYFDFLADHLGGIIGVKFFKGKRILIDYHNCRVGIAELPQGLEFPQSARHESARSALENQILDLSLSRNSSSRNF